jgi:hypothetical protein
MPKHDQPADAPDVTCDTCGTTQNSKLTGARKVRVPRGWKRQADAVQCPKCRKQAGRIVAVAFPVAAVLDGGTWEEFTKGVRDACRRSARLANWGVTRLAMAEPSLGASDTLARQPHIYLYGLLDQ